MLRQFFFKFSFCAFCWFIRRWRFFKTDKIEPRNNILLLLHLQHRSTRRMGVYFSHCHFFCCFFFVCVKESHFKAGSISQLPWQHSNRAGVPGCTETHGEHLQTVRKTRFNTRPFNISKLLVTNKTHEEFIYLDKLAGVIPSSRVRYRRDGFTPILSERCGK